ncbi:MAG: SPFH domain-containing protein, partial [Bacillota bacterium]
MFGKNKTISLKERTNNLIEQVDGAPFKKKSMLDIPKGYVAILIESDGTSEIIRDTHQYKLDRDVHAIFYAKANALVQTTKWGTRSRVPIKTKAGEAKSLGAFGTLTFKLVNPLRYINKKMGTDQDVKPEALKNMVIEKITDVLHDVVHTYGTIELEDKAFLPSLKKDVTEALAIYLDDYGIKIDDFIIEKLNTTPSSQEG